MWVADMHGSPALPSVPRREGPIVRIGDETVLDRIVMDIIGMRGEIVLVGDDMLPIAALPDAAFAGVRAPSPPFAAGGARSPS